MKKILILTRTLGTALFVSVNSSNCQKQSYLDCILLHLCPKTNWKVFWQKIWSYSKYPKNSYQVRKIWAHFRNWTAPIFNWNCVKCIPVTKMFKEFNIERHCGDLDPKKNFLRQPSTIYLRLTVVFMWSSMLPEKFNFRFSRDFC